MSWTTTAATATVLHTNGKILTGVTAINVNFGNDVGWEKMIHGKP
jgi:hypothetical protein